MALQNTTSIVEEIEKRTSGLMFLSEGDFPFNVFCCKTREPLPEFFARQAGRPKEDFIEETSLSYLFKNVTSIPEKGGKKEVENADKYQKLLEYITSTLNDIKVYRIGEREVDIFIVGSTNDGDFIYLSTKSIES